MVPDIIFIGMTDAEGHISSWNNTQGAPLPRETIGTHGAFVELHGGVTSTIEYMVGHYSELPTPSSRVVTSVWKLEFNLAEIFQAGNSRPVKIATLHMEVLVKQGEQTHISVQAGPYGITVNSV
jgi:hypothetical protein